MPATLVFDKDTYAPTEVIRFQVVVDPEPMSRSVTVTGSVEAADGTELPAEATTTVHGVYGDFIAAGYIVDQDATDPSRFVAAPA